MSDTERTERSQTRYPTPEPALDDHRRQPSSLPTISFADPPEAPRRRGTLASIVSLEQSRRGGDGSSRSPNEHLDVPRLQIDHLDLPDVGHYDSITRDFEHAIHDDDKSFVSNRSTGSRRSQRSADESWHRERRGSLSPMRPRRGTFRTHNRRLSAGVSSHSSRGRSSSPPNSVDAFAPPKPGRPRTGTVNSRAPSEAGLSLHHTNSYTSHSRRRPTNDDGTNGPRTDAASHRSSVEEDVCFPPEEINNSYNTIDFEDLEEFVAQTHSKTPVAHPFTLRFEQPEDTQNRVFQDLRHGPARHTAPLDGLEQFSNDIKQVEVPIKEKEEDLSEETLIHFPNRDESSNRFTFFSSGIDETIHAYELGGLLMPGETFRDLFELDADAGVWWLDMLNPTEEEIFAICGAFRVHPLTREDITTQETREKVELFKSYYFMCFRSFYAIDKSSENYLEPINVYAVVFREGLLTFSFCQNTHAAHVRQRISRLRDYVNLSADWVCYALIDEIVDSFAPVLDDLERATDSIEDSVFTARFDDSRAVLKQIGDCRKRVMALLRLLGGKADVIRGFAKKCNEAYSVAPRGDVGLYLSDVQDHVVTMMSNLGHFEKILGRSHGNHLTQISLQHTEQGSRSNELLGKITVFATICVPLNLIAGLFGMNVPVPGKNATSLGWWFGIIGCMLAFTTFCMLVARRYRYV